MNITLLFASIISGLVVRVTFILANFIHRRCALGTGVVCDCIFTLLSILPFISSLHVFGNGSIPFYAVAFYLATILLSFAIKKPKKVKINKVKR